MSWIIVVVLLIAVVLINIRVNAGKRDLEKRYGKTYSELKREFYDR